MNKGYNYQSFTPEEVEQGLHWELLKTLLNYNHKSDTHYNDIHIYTEEIYTIIEWTTIPYDGSYGGKFTFVDEDQIVMIDKQFPDNHSELCYDEDDYQERLEMFLKANPGWVKTSYGTWTNEIENKKFKEEFNKK